MMLDFQMIIFFLKQLKKYGMDRGKQDNRALGMALHRCFRTRKYMKNQEPFDCLKCGMWMHNLRRGKSIVWIWIWVEASRVELLKKESV